MAQIPPEILEEKLFLFKKLRILSIQKDWTLLATSYTFSSLVNVRKIANSCEKKVNLFFKNYQISLDSCENSFLRTTVCDNKEINVYLKRPTEFEWYLVGEKCLSQSSAMCDFIFTAGKQRCVEVEEFVPGKMEKYIGSAATVCEEKTSVICQKAECFLHCIT